MTTIFEKQLKALDKISEKLAKTDMQIKGGLTKATNKFNESLEKTQKITNRLHRTFDKIYSLTKGIGLTGVGLLSGSMAFGAYKGIQANKDSIKAKELGISTKQQGALEFAGKVVMEDQDFFTNLARSIKEASVSDTSADAFGALGLDFQKIRDMPALEALTQFFEKANQFKGDMSILKTAIGEITGLDYMKFKNIDFGKFQQYYQEGLKYSSNSAEQMKTMGVATHRLTASFENLINNLMSKLSPAITQVFNSMSKGLNALTKNKEFNSAMQKMGDWFKEISKGFDKKVVDAIKTLPEIFRKMQITFYNILGALAEASTWLLMGDADDKAQKASQEYYKKAKILESRGDVENIKKSNTVAEFLKHFENLKKNASEYGLRLSKENAQAIKDKMIQLNITINNDTTQGQQQRTLTETLKGVK